MTYRYLFGPVPSRRLGMSLGVDMVPHKVCSFNCVYCECGPTTIHTTERKEYVPTDRVLDDLNHFFENNPDPDYLTFSGAGEPTLHSEIGTVIKRIKEMRPGIPVAVLTNGSLLHSPKVRQDLFAADLVLPSLDAALEGTYYRINRPVRSIGIKDYIRGLIAFRQEFKGELWLEILVLPGYNDDSENLEALKKVLLKINPDRIQLNTLDRPGAVEGLSACTHSELERIAEKLGMKQVEIIARPRARRETDSYRKDVESTIMETISRRPCTSEDIGDMLGLHINEVHKYLGVLESSGKIETTTQDRGVFYRISHST